MEKVLMSNIVKKEQMRKVTSDTLNEIANTLKSSYGPNGSYTKILADKALTKFTKDGHTILENIQYHAVLENSLREDLINITRNIVKTVGDGTTSAVILSSIIFDKLIELENSLANNINEMRMPSNSLVKSFKRAIDNIIKIIKDNGHETTANDIYNIAYTSTDGNEEVARTIKGIYKDFGMGVFIDVNSSTGPESYLKSYDGLSLESGISDTCFINDTPKAKCVINDASIYAFRDPIDTPEMYKALDTIINNNIMKAYKEQKYELIRPTVILAPKLSSDISTYIASIAEFLYRFDDQSKPPLLIVTNIFSQEIYYDIVTICGAKMIKKYINPDLQKADQEKGLAPTLENISDFCGHADIVESDINSTKFVNPKEMFNEDGTTADTYAKLLDFLNSEYKKAKEEGEAANVTGALKRRINALNCNLVEYFVGGISAADRESLRDLVEDAVKNCRDAAVNGTGFGANFEGLRAVNTIINPISSESANMYSSIDMSMYNLIYDAYTELADLLYADMFTDIGAAAKNMLKNNQPMNIRKKIYDGTVLSSINTEIVILSSIADIITLLFTTNQCLVQDPIRNVYLKVEN